MDVCVGGVCYCLIRLSQPGLACVGLGSLLTRGWWVGGVCYCSLRLSQPSLAGVGAGAELGNIKHYFEM